MFATARLANVVDDKTATAITTETQSSQRKDTNRIRDRRECDLILPSRSRSPCSLCLCGSIARSSCPEFILSLSKGDEIPSLLLSSVF